MKILDFCINEYSLERVPEELKETPLFDRIPESYLGFYLQKCKTEIRAKGELEWKPAEVIQLRQRIND